MNKTLMTLLTLIALLAIATGAFAEKDTDAKLKALEKRLQTLERKSAKDRIQWTGDLRVEAHSITGEVDPYIDGMRMQALTYGAMFMVESGANPTDPGAIDQFIGENYAEFQVFRGMNDFPEVKDWVQEMMATNPNMGAMMQAFAMDAYRDGFKTDNDILYTTRLRLNMNAKVAKNIAFDGRLSMYKPWGSSTQTGVFNGQANTLNTDANWPGVAGDATLKVDRAFFTWKNIADIPLLSLIHISEPTRRRGISYAARAPMAPPSTTATMKSARARPWAPSSTCSSTAPPWVTTSVPGPPPDSVTVWDTNPSMATVPWTGTRPSRTPISSA